MFWHIGHVGNLSFGPVRAMQNVHNILYIRDDTYYMCKSVYSHDIVVYSVKSVTIDIILLWMYPT